MKPSRDGGAGDSANRSPELADMSVRDFLQRLSSPQLPAGGGGAAVMVAMAAAVAEMAANVSHRGAGASPAADRLRRIRNGAHELLEAEAESYAAVMAARHQRGSDAAEALRDALIGASDGPLELAELAAEVAVLGARLAREGKRTVFADAAAAVTAATAAARTARAIVVSNLGNLPDQQARIGRATDLVARAAAAERIVLAMRVPSVPISR
ncbi:MAG: cyclodeaminase/cyclohydrolase family protein [Ectothiorhodospiraceae bacterium]